MIQEKSAGFLIYRNEEKTKYLLLHYPAGHWDYPKGHVEEGEEELETALRELREETGIKEKEVKVIDDFRETIDYVYQKRGQLSHKEVVYFLGKTDKKNIKISREHQDHTWLPYKEGLDRLTFKNARDLLIKAHDHLKK